MLNIYDLLLNDLDRSKVLNQNSQMPANLRQLTFQYEKTWFRTLKSQNLFDLVNILYRINLEDDDVQIVLKNIASRVNDAYTLSYCSPTQLKGFGLTTEQIKTLYSYFDDNEIMENVLSQEHTEFNNLRNMVQHLGQFKGFQLFQYPKFNKEEIIDSDTYRSLIIIGETGTGKTTFINYFINSYLDVQINDNFRYQLVQENQSLSQAFSRTSEVNIYYIKPYQGKLGLRIIDTPGFCDTKGVQQDQIIVKQIENCIKTQVESLSTICFLVKSSACRLTLSQNYVLSAILSIFAIDVIQNFVFVFTFYDGSGEPQALEALKFQGDQDNAASPVYDKINLINHPWYLQTNNSCLFEQSTNPFNQTYWEIASNCMNELYVTKILRNTQQSLNLTREVISKRNQIVIIVEQLRKVINMQLNEIANLKNNQKQIKQLDSELKATKNFKVKNIKHVTQKIDLKQGEYATNCLICNYTCHYPCRLPDDQKQKCSAMKDGKCTICYEKCSWKLHNNMQFRLEDKVVEVETELEDLKIKHQIVLQDKDSKKNLINSLEKNITNLQKQCMEKQVELKQQINQLNLISLQQPCFKYQEQYADLMIQQEEDNKQEGYVSRINALKEMKEHWKIIRENQTLTGSENANKKILQN
ncbi:hypothetical protein pb186bvf_000385 [Paramecium bursaria]